jgi:hypothetical protein
MRQIMSELREGLLLLAPSLLGHILGGAYNPGLRCGNLSAEFRVYAAEFGCPL